MNKKQWIVISVSAVIIALSLIFPPKALIRDKKVIMRVIPFGTKKIQGRGILIETCYRDPSLTRDWQRLAPFIVIISLAGGILVYILQTRER
ncbi:MAG: hypothetical protein AABY43_02265 [Candidatus Omnitrophota bacterium]